MINLLKYRQIYGPLLYLLAYALLLPTFDNVHYFFLLTTCKLSLAHYDILCILPYLGTACGTIYFLRYMRNIPMKQVVGRALWFQVVYTLLQIFNVKRWNTVWMLSDFWFNIPLFFFSKIIQVSLATLPVFLFIQNI